MTIVLLLVIIAILLFGAAQVRHVLIQVIFFITAVLVTIVVWAAVSHVTLAEVLTLGAGIIVIAAIGITTFTLLSRHHDAVAKRDAIQNTWDFYEKRGTFAQNETIRAHAMMLRDRGDAWELDAYCQSQEKGRLPPDAPVQRVWGWFAEDIDKRFDPDAQVQAQALFDANDALQLDRFCRAQLDRLERKD